MTSALRSLALLAVLLVGSCLVAGAASRPAAPVLPVGLSEALADARALASLNEGATVLQVAGASMHPYFGDGALLVVRPVAAGQLRKGMVVVYRNRFGELVAHRLVARRGEGWVAQGYNNAATDSTLVEAANLRGVVYATIHTAGGAGNPVAGMPERVLAAPAR